MGPGGCRTRASHEGGCCTRVRVAQGFVSHEDTHPPTHPPQLTSPPSPKRPPRWWGGHGAPEPVTVAWHEEPSHEEPSHEELSHEEPSHEEPSPSQTEEPGRAPPPTAPRHGGGGGAPRHGGGPCPTQGVGGGGVLCLGPLWWGEGHWGGSLPYGGGLGPGGGGLEGAGGVSLSYICGGGAAPRYLGEGAGGATCPI